MNDIAEDDVIDVYIGNGSSISGDLQSYGKVVIEGTMDGTIHAQSMTIGKTGKVAGAATVDDADIAGRFANALEVDGTLTIRSSGQVEGSISYDNIELEKGAKIYGAASLSKENTATSD